MLRKVFGYVSASFQTAVVCYCGWRRGKNCRINVVNSQVFPYYIYVAHNMVAMIQTGVIPSGEINRRRESFFSLQIGIFNKIAFAILLDLCVTL